MGIAAISNTKAVISPQVTDYEELGKAAHKGNQVALQHLLEMHPQANLAALDSHGVSIWDHAVIGARTSHKLDTLKELLFHQFGELSTQILEFFSKAFSKLQLAGIFHAYRQTQADGEPGLSGIHLAAFQGDLQQVQEFCRNKQNIHLKTASGHTALHFAALKNHPQIAEFLIQQGCSVNATDLTDSTPLHYAMLHENTALSKLLLENGADPNLCNRFELSPLAIFAAFLKLRGYSKDSLHLEKADWAQLFLLLGSHCWHIAGWRGSIFLDLLSQISYLSNPRNNIHTTSTDSSLTYYGKKMLELCSNILLMYNLMELTLRGLGEPTTALSAVSWYVSLPVLAHNTYAVAKNALKGIKNSWDQTAYETYRPIRNMCVHMLNSTRLLRSWSRFLEGPPEEERPGEWEWEWEWEPPKKPAGAPDCSGQTTEALAKCILEKNLDPKIREHAEYLFKLNAQDRGSKEYCPAMRRSFRDLSRVWHPDHSTLPKEESRPLFAALSEGQSILREEFCLG